MTYLHRSAVLSSFTLLAVLASSANAQNDAVKPDPAKVLGYETCAKCHGQELNLWKQTPHFETYKELHRKPEAKEIAQRMGQRSIKRGDLCVKCHYTEQQSGGRVKAVSGISCESCHGAAQDWLAIHNDYGGPNATKESESPEHKSQRREAAMQAGMQNPTNVYLIARSCYNCHTVPNEKLVNVGGHAAGSDGFELVAWSQGSIRHNFVRGGGSNVPSARERLRVMYVVGLMTNVEYSFRAAAQATEVAKFGTTSAQRAYNARRQLAVIQEQLNHPLLTQALDMAYSIKLKSNNSEALTLAADEIGTAAFQFAATEDGTKLSAVDAFLPSPSTYK